MTIGKYYLTKRISSQLRKLIKQNLILEKFQLQRVISLKTKTRVVCKYIQIITKDLHKKVHYRNEFILR
jgi:hypothetical protein